MKRKIALVVRKVNMKNTNQSIEDMEYWLSKTPQERLSAVTFLINQNMAPGKRMDKTIHNQLKMHL